MPEWKNIAKAIAFYVAFAKLYPDINKNRCQRGEAWRNQAQQGF